MLFFPPGWVLPMAVVALLADALLGDPAWLYRRLPHPVALIGAAIARLEARLLDPAMPAQRKRRAGVCLLVAVAGASAAVGSALHVALSGLPAGWLAEGLLASTLLAQRSPGHRQALQNAFDRGRPFRNLTIELTSEPAGGWWMLSAKPVLPTNPAGGGWRRYLELILDAIGTAPQKRSLPTAPELRGMSDADNWPL